MLPQALSWHAARHSAKRSSTPSIAGIVQDMQTSSSELHESDCSDGMPQQQQEQLVSEILRDMHSSSPEPTHLAEADSFEHASVPSTPEQMQNAEVDLSERSPGPSSQEQMQVGGADVFERQLALSSPEQMQNAEANFSERQPAVSSQEQMQHAETGSAERVPAPSSPEQTQHVDAGSSERAPTPPQQAADTQIIVVSGSVILIVMFMEFCMLS